MTIVIFIYFIDLFCMNYYNFCIKLTFFKEISMDHAAIYKQLATLSTDELYYRKCYEDKVPPVIPHPDADPSHLTERAYFPDNPKQNIVVLKHKCYTASCPHHHDFFEIFYVLKGKSCHEIGGRYSKMQQGDFCLIPPKTVHCISVNDESAVIDILIRRSAFEHVFSNLLSDNNILAAFFSCNTYTAAANDYIIFHTGRDEELMNLILDMYLECEAKENYYEMILDTQLVMLFGRLLRSYESSCELPPFSSRTDSQIWNMVQFLRQNYRDVTLKKLAEKFHYTPEYTSKLLHDVTGRTFSTLLTQIRMEQAVRLLCSTSLSIADVGQKAGYATPEHFIRTFKKTYGRTPSEYRKGAGILYK